ncbi:MAG: aldo/keto reductase [Christensenellales bacterium]|jgi:aryl-alcohol dehydrogenase-like predicted oxidoreductase
MRYKPFGKTDMNASVMTVGTWAIGGAQWGSVDQKDSVEAIRTLLDGGVNFIDTAPIYGHGHSEEVVGEAIRGYDRTKLYIATKFGLTWPEGKDGPMVKNASYDSAMKELDDSLRRIGTDYIDLYIVHWPDIDVKAPAEETMRALNDMKKAGKIRYVGVSNYSKEQILEIEQFGAVDAQQPPYSMVNRSVEDLMIWAHEKGIANMTYGSLGAGILTGAIRTLPEFEPNDFRLIFYDFFTEPKFSKVMELLKTLDKIAQDRGVPLAQIAVNWNAQTPFVDTALIGVRNAAEAKENLAAMDWTLSDEEMSIINRAIDETVGR